MQSVDRAFDILEILAQNRDGMQLSEIGEVLELNKSTVHRLLASLKDRGYIAQEESSGRYRLGLGLIALSSQFLNRLEIKTEAEPYLRKLSRDLGETVFLATLRSGEVVYLDKVERFDGLRRYSIIGQRVPIHCTSLGKSLVLDTPDSEILEILTSRPMQSFTPNTITDHAKYLAEIQKYRIQGWSHDAEEHNSGVSCVAAPIRDYRGIIIAAISSAWEGAKTTGQIRQIGELLKSTADHISTQLGYIAAE